MVSDAEVAERALAWDRQQQQVGARNHVRLLRKANSLQMTTLFSMHKEKRSLLLISQHLKMAPCIVARVFLEFGGQIAKPNIYKALLSTVEEDASTYLSGRLLKEVRECVLNDVHCSPLCDRIRRSEGDEYEHMMILRLYQLGIPFENEHMLRERGLAKTPDALLLVPIQVKGKDGNWHLVQWIDSKAMAHETGTENEAQHIAQAHAYVNRFGPGMLLYWMGMDDTVVDIPDVMVVDEIPTDIRLPGQQLIDGKKQDPERTKYDIQAADIRVERNEDGIPCSYLLTSNFFLMAITLDTHDGGAGRWIAACDEFPVGSLVLESVPFSYVLSPSLWGERCQVCFEQAKLSRCSRCKMVFYCSKSCQQVDWKTHHKLECSRLEPMLQSLAMHGNQSAFVSIASDILLVARTLRLLAKMPGEKKEKITQDTVTPSDMVWFEQDRERFQHTATIVEHSGLLPQNLRFTKAQIEEMLCRFHVNNFMITDELLLDIGTGCFPWGAMVNHSCDNNCAVTYAPKTHNMQLRAIRPIHSGEEITQTYVDVGLPPQNRRRQLKEHYHFHCQCARCVSPPSFDTFSSSNKSGGVVKPSDALDMAQKMIQEATYMPPYEAIECLKKARTIRTNELHRWNTERLEIFSRLLTLYIDTQNLKEAVNMATEIWAFYQEMYPKNHALSGLHLYTLGDLERQSSGQRENAITHLQEAHRILSITHGKAHNIVYALQDLMVQLQK
ncbi:hypothetical protein THRCLA_03998 [Thraustotheca clavata]|uniref:MYND-type domain-containing protein n=1 Tax=Thraustotheca clavata TaxID=74557 RepID=A0A1W0A092_9STRA|nr:hypothetical protein THRCLA_03998 [Thraustotheca clavata]